MSRNNDTQETVKNVMFARKRKGGPHKDKTGKSKPGNKEEFKYRCRRCKEKDYKTVDCKNKKPEDSQSVKSTEDTLLCAVEEFPDIHEAFRVKNRVRDAK